MVNKENALNSDYEPNDLVKVNVESTKDNIYMSEIAAENLENMFKAAKEDGINLYIVSGYRSSSYQNNLYYTLNDEFYRYNPKDGSEKIFYNYELAFNSDNMIYLYIK